MKPIDLCIGIAVREGGYEVATLEAGGVPASYGFPPSALGQAVLKVFLAGQERHLRLAISGDAAMGCALSLGGGGDRDVYIVARRVADQAAELARYASRAP
ncbi:hypothetical protein [Zoogloea sp.]|uniref:hypothetical protein n=1 Tax=Zoogloea sp. TaxID=49181 RepID=UPI001415E8C9|nr:MAG: hypothetical protein F9K15_02930 [Zoogloea sp.]